MSQYARQELIGSGDTRDAYLVTPSEYPYDTDVVLKLGDVGANYMETKMWNYVSEHPELHSESARIHEYSQDYTWILMEYVDTSKGSKQDIDRTILRKHDVTVGVVKEEEDIGYDRNGDVVMVDYPFGHP